MRPFDRRPVSSGFFSPMRVSYRPRPDELESRPDTLNLQPSDLEHQTTSIEYPPFKKLPTELIVSIAELLPPHSAALFTLTSRLVSISLGTKYLGQLRAKIHMKSLLSWTASKETYRDTYYATTVDGFIATLCYGTIHGREVLQNHAIYKTGHQG